MAGKKYSIPEKPDADTPLHRIVLYIIGNHAHSMFGAARLLDAEKSPTVLQFLGGHSFVTQGYVARRKWLEKLKRMEPQRFSEAQPFLLQALGRVNANQGTNKKIKRQPDTFGFILLEAIGGANANISHAAVRLEINSTTLNSMTSGGLVPSTKGFEKLLDGLMRKFPENAHLHDRLRVCAALERISAARIKRGHPENTAAL